MKNDWINVADRMPTNNKMNILYINGDKNSSHSFYYTGGYDVIYKEWLNPFGDRIEENVTHWMPLPNPPTPPATPPITK